MIVIACLDDNGGMMFNHRRQSQDQHFDIDLSGGNWKICESVEFTGHSHERITIEVYLR